MDKSSKDQLSLDLDPLELRYPDYYKPLQSIGENIKELTLSLMSIFL